MAMADPTLLATDVLYDSPRCRFGTERFDTPHGTVERPVVHHPGAVGIIAQPRADRVILVRQFRYPLRRWTLEIPAGTCDPGEDPRDSALRELAEETGLVADTLHEVLRCYPAVGLSDELLIIYRAGHLQGGSPRPDRGELLSPETVAVDDLARLRSQGAICDAKTLLALHALGLAIGAAEC